jgi:hypothetical protein
VRGPQQRQGGTTDDAVAKEAAAKKTTMDVDATEEAAAVKATAEKTAADRATADKTAADKATADKVAADKAVVDNAIADERAPEEAAAMKTVAAGAAQKSIMELAGPGSTLAPVAGSKRAATHQRPHPSSEMVPRCMEAAVCCPVLMLVFLFRFVLVVPNMYFL